MRASNNMSLCFRIAGITDLLFGMVRVARIESWNPCAESSTLEPHDKDHSLSSRLEAAQPPDRRDLGGGAFVPRARRDLYPRPPDASLSLGMTRRRSSKGKWEEKIED